MSEHNKEVTADKIGYFPNEQGDYTVTYNDEPFCVARYEKEAKWIVREFRSIIEREREDALQSSQNFEKFSLYRETPTVATDHTVMEPSPAQEVEKPDFEQWWNENERRWHCAHMDEKQIARSAFEYHDARIKELEQEAFFIKLHRDSAQEDASSLRAIIKSLEAENKELREKLGHTKGVVGKYVFDLERFFNDLPVGQPPGLETLKDVCDWQPLPSKSEN